ncbi:MAG: hypothetical protein Q8M76_13325 [Spirochaetaceae bacterium]|nr:hypothetical protein [Spirochaetaceae bacterium]
MADESTEEEPNADPLVVYATRGFDNYTFALDIESRERLREICGAEKADLLPRRVTVAMGVKAQLEALFGSIEPHVIPLLTGLDHPHLSELGGVELRESSTDQTVWRLPQKAA